MPEFSVYSNPNFQNKPGQFNSLPQMQQPNKGVGGGFDVGGLISTAAGAAGMANPLIGAGIAAAGSIFGAVRGMGQRRQAKRIRENAVDPGFQMNTGVMQNAETLRNRYGNYQIPGYNQLLNNINAGGASAFNMGLQGASSGGDVLDLATKIAYGTGRQKRDLGVLNAQGQESAMNDYLGANVAAGQQRQMSNQYDIQKYQQQLAEAAALYGASDQNLNNAATGLSSIGTSLALNPKRIPKP